MITITLDQASTIKTLAKLSSNGTLQITAFDFKEVVGVIHRPADGSARVNTIVAPDGAQVWSSR